MKSYSTELMVGIFVVAGMAAMAYISIHLGGVEVLGPEKYTLYAEFESTTGVDPGAAVEIAGVQVGTVEEIDLEKDKFLSRVRMGIDHEVRIPQDSMASVRTRGLVGDKFIEITPGGSTERLEGGELIFDTEPSVSIEELIGKYVFSQ